MSALVVDTSALVARRNNEPPGEWLRAELRAATTRVIAAPTAVELGGYPILCVGDDFARTDLPVLTLTGRSDL
ncbi:MAG: type II toxin-antitoxin system VapC family toxin [Nocardioidaceae bacterium]|nr:type II toxin-antitoxin system VapC family toxin [Nocardioidaceae bacterium]